MNQYKKASNIYFTAIAYFQTVDMISNTMGKTTIVLPLGFVIAFSMLKDAFEDYKRSKEDKLENNKIVEVFMEDEKGGNGTFLKQKWMDVSVGQIVKLSDGQHAPADLVLIHSTG